jgi:iron complex transport system substrate-binding protein
MRWMLVGIIFTLFLLAPHAYPLTPKSANAEPISVTDDLGRDVRFMKPPERIVSLAPGLTEILFSLGLDDRIVGVTDYCNFPQEALSKTRVGGLNANIERILALHPDLVVAVAGLYQQENLSRFERFHIPYFVVDPSSLEKIFGTILVFGKIADVKETAVERVRQLRARLDGVRQRVRSLPPARLLYVVDKEPLISVGKGSYLADLIREAGGINIAGGLEKDYPMLSMEYVIQQDPQVIILAMDADRTLSDQEKRYWDRWSSLSAVRDGKIYKVDRDLLNRPGPRVMDGLEELARLLHPAIDFKPGR